MAYELVVELEGGLTFTRRMDSGPGIVEQEAEKIARNGAWEEKEGARVFHPARRIHAVWMRPAD